VLIELVLGNNKKRYSNPTKKKYDDTCGSVKFSLHYKFFAFATLHFQVLLLPSHYIHHIRRDSGALQTGRRILLELLFESRGVSSCGAESSF
jgi:hypothetical protein